MATSPCGLGLVDLFTASRALAILSMLTIFSIFSIPAAGLNCLIVLQRIGGVDGQPNGWMTRTGGTLTLCGFQIGVPIVLVVAKRMISAGEMVRAFPSVPVFQLVVDNVLKLFDIDAGPVASIAVSGARNFREVAEIARRSIKEVLEILVIFIPVAFMQGRIGRFFSSFGYTFGFAILMRMFVSFTMTPIISPRFLKLERGQANDKRGFFAGLIDDSYLWILRNLLRHSWTNRVLSILVFFTPVVFGWIGEDFVPKDEQSDFEHA